MCNKVALHNRSCVILIMAVLCSCTSPTIQPTSTLPTAVPSPTLPLLQGINIRVDKETLSPGDMVLLTVVDSTGQDFCYDRLTYSWGASGKGKWTLPDGSGYTFLNTTGACKVFFKVEEQPVLSDAALTAQPSRGTAPDLITINLIVLAAEQSGDFMLNKTYGKAVYSLMLIYPSSVYYHFVLDASERMNETDQSGITLLDETKQTIATQAAQLRDDIYIGLRTFGPESEPGSSKVCQNTKLVSTFAPRVTGKYQTALQQVQASGLPSLLAAIRLGIHDIITDLPGGQSLPNPPRGIDPYHLIVYTGVKDGLDQCTALSVEAQLKAIKEENADKVDINVFLVARVTNDREATELKALSEGLSQATRIPVWPHPVFSTAEFPDLLESIFGLSSSDVLVAYQASLDLNLNVAEVLQARAIYEGAIGEYEDARADLERLQAQFPESAETSEFWYLRGVTLANLYKWSESVDAFTSAIALDQTYALAYYGRGIALTNLGKIEEANLSFKEAYELDSNLLAFRSESKPDFITSDYFFTSDTAVVNPFFLSNPNFYSIVARP